MVIWPAFRMGQYRGNDHPYHAPQLNPIISIFYLYLVKIVQIRSLKKEESVIAQADEHPEKKDPKDGLVVDRGFNIYLTLVQILLQH